MHRFCKIEFNWKKLIRHKNSITETRASSSGLYYKHVIIVSEDVNIVNQWSLKLIIDDAIVIIYDRNMFIIQATGKVDCRLDSH
jgi:hypothetical protein